MPPSPTPYRCLSCRLSQLAVSAPRRQVHQSAAKRARQSAYPNVKAVDLGLMKPATQSSMPVRTREYSKADKKLLAEKYSKEQMAVIEAGEKAIPAEDLERQGLQRTDPLRVSYFDDFSTYRPVIDTPPEGVSEEETARQLDLIQGRNKKEPAEALTPDQIALKRLSKLTGMTMSELRNLHTKELVSHRVVNQTRMGKIASRYTLTVVGDGAGMLGIGEGKARLAAGAKRLAFAAAVRSMKPILRYEDRTIYGDLEAKVCASIVQLQARPPGFGNRCQHLIFELARAAGIHDIAARTPRSRNKMNVVKAAYKALVSQRSPEDIARARGRKLIDVRKVYYGGSVP